MQGHRATVHDDRRPSAACAAAGRIAAPAGAPSAGGAAGQASPAISRTVAACLGPGRIVVSEAEAPNVF